MGKILHLVYLRAESVKLLGKVGDRSEVNDIEYPKYFVAEDNLAKHALGGVHPMLALRVMADYCKQRLRWLAKMLIIGFAVKC